MIYFADLHVHSKFSRATSKECDLIQLAHWAALKGLRVVTTGDFTHPAWREEIKELLVDAEDGLFRLKDSTVPASEGLLPGGFGPGDVRFMLGVEISSIYKKAGATRKVHNLIYMPDFDSMDRFSDRLGRIGNIRSDGRPILGLDSRHLLEISLETTAESFFIPAHIWTPWFSILGSRSGFDSVEECFDDLTSHVFALETGLSSDPEMNHRVSALDRYTLTSNSDTHSPSKLGRQANIFRGTPGFAAIREGIRAGGAWARGMSPAELLALETGEAGPAAQSTFVGTMDFFPEEGKYHLDGHRKCGVRLEPEETENVGGKCPVCGHPVTVGVMNRVVELADRPKGAVPDRAAPFWRLLPLGELVGEALGVGAQSKRVAELYRDLLRKIGPELPILWSIPLEDIDVHAPDIITEAIRRARAGEVRLEPGFDGQYGVVKLFGEGERDHFSGQGSFIPVRKPTPRRTATSGRQRKPKSPAQPADADPEPVPGLNQEQLAAVEVRDRAVLVQAGPGTGKTRTLTHRIAALIRDDAARPTHITAVTFTRKAAQEMRERLEKLIPSEHARQCWVGTFHQLGARILDSFQERGLRERRGNVLDEDQAMRLFREAVRAEGLDVAPAAVPRLYAQMSILKQGLAGLSRTGILPVPAMDRQDAGPTEAVGGRQDAGSERHYGDHDPVRNASCGEPLPARAYAKYHDLLRRENALDLDDLLVEPVRLLREFPAEADRMSGSVAAHLLVDEFQDVNKAQYEMVRLLAHPQGKGLFVIGDPDQAIYGFRGADRKFFERLAADYPGCARVRLAKNYRSQNAILSAARQVLDEAAIPDALVAQRDGQSPVKLVQLPNAATEAEFIVRTIDALLGGSSFFSFDSRKSAMPRQREWGFSDFAVIYRLNAVGDALEKAFSSANLPFQRARSASPREEAEALDPRAQAITLMTIHASKGLEFPVVFVAGCEDGIIPYEHAGDNCRTNEDQDEERRLLYVAMTRAADELFLTRAEQRALHGRQLSTRPSPYLARIHRSVREALTPLAHTSGARQKGPSQCELFG
jgi:DNA helicase II / ATP-dependent DNA helicase PcrA